MIVALFKVRSPYPLARLDNSGPQSSTFHAIFVAHYLAEEGVAVAVSRRSLIALSLEYTCLRKTESFEPATVARPCQLWTVAARYLSSLRRLVVIEV